MEEHLKKKRARASKPRSTRRQLRNGVLWLLAIAYWQMIGTPLAHFAILTAPYHNRSILVTIGNAHSWWDAYGSGWMLIGSELIGIFVTGITALAVVFVIMLLSTVGENIYWSLSGKRRPMDD